MVLGIIFLVIFFAGVLTFIGSLLAIIFGGVGISRAGRLGGEGKGKATAGLILGILALLVYLLFGLFSLGIGWFI
jgi:hypothetical protein